MGKLLIVDVETGGIDPTKDALVEVAWAGISGPIKHLTIPHDPMLVQPEAAHLNGYVRRGLGDPTTWASQTFLDNLEATLTGATIVGSNPAFDAASLRRWLYPHAPWHYRMLDIESMGYQAGFRSRKFPDGVPGLYDLVLALRDLGYFINEPDHSAVSDVRATRDVFIALTTGRFDVSVSPKSLAASA